MNKLYRPWAWPGIGLALLALGVPLATAGSAPLDLPAVIAAALQRNFAIQIQRVDSQRANLGINQALGAYDPQFSMEYTLRRQDLAANSGVDQQSSLQLGVGSTLPWGTRWRLALDVDERTTPFDPLTGRAVDSVTSFAGLVVTQPLLRGFGSAGTHSPVLIARASAARAAEALQAAVEDTIIACVNAFHAVHIARENLRIAAANRDLALQLLADNRRRVESGSLAPLDLVQAESEAALRGVTVIDAQLALRRATNNLKALIWDDPASVTGFDLVITDPPAPQPFDPVFSRDLQLALAHRPDFRAAQRGLDIRDLEVRQLRRNALPQLDIVAAVGSQAADSSASSSLRRTLNDGDASFSVGAVLSVPFPNRAASAAAASARLARNQSALSLLELEQAIYLQLDIGAAELLASRDRIVAARTARELASQSLAAELRKLQAGTSTTFVVLRLQGDLAVAEIREINSLADYNVTLARYHKARGQLLEHAQVQLTLD
jgi:outer membrane protein